MLKIEKAYIAGFFDGEGCLNIYIQSKRYKSITYWYPRLQVTVTNNNNLLLEEIVSILGFGHVYPPASRTLTYTIRINVPEAILKFIEVLEPYIKGKKKELAIMKEAASFLVKHRGYHCEPHQAFWTKEKVDEFERNYVIPMKRLKNTKRGRHKRWFRK